MIEIKERILSGIFRRKKCFQKKMGCREGHFLMDGEENVGFMLWGSQSVDSSEHQRTPKESRKTSNGVGKLRPSTVHPFHRHLPDHHHHHDRLVYYKGQKRKRASKSLKGDFD